MGFALPLGLLAGDPDVYGYCLDDPVNGVDRTGLLGDFGIWDLKPATKEQQEALNAYLKGELMPYSVFTKYPADVVGNTIQAAGKVQAEKRKRKMDSKEQLKEFGKAYWEITSSGLPKL